MEQGSLSGLLPALLRAVSHSPDATTLVFQGKLNPRVVFRRDTLNRVCEIRCHFSLATECDLGAAPAKNSDIAYVGDQEDGDTPPIFCVTALLGFINFVVGSEEGRRHLFLGDAVVCWIEYNSNGDVASARTGMSPAMK